MGIDPDNPDFPAAVDTTDGTDRQRVVAAQKDGNLAGSDRLLGCFIDGLANVSNRVAEPITGLAGQSVPYRHIDITPIPHIITEQLQSLRQTGIADRTGPHINAPLVLSQIDRDADNAQRFFKHRSYFNLSLTAKS